MLTERGMDNVVGDHVRAVSAKEAKHEEDVIRLGEELAEEERGNTCVLLL
jgi:hypothetical protein